MRVRCETRLVRFLFYLLVTYQIISEKMLKITFFSVLPKIFSTSMEQTWLLSHVEMPWLIWQSNINETF